MKPSDKLHTAATPGSDSDSARAENVQEQCFPGSPLLLWVPKSCIDDVCSIDRPASCRLRVLFDPKALSPYQSAADTFVSKQP